MVTCPKCGRSTAGNPRACGYCGTSLVQNYFGTPQKSPPATQQPESSPHLGTGAAASLTLGIFGCVSLLAALIFWLSPLFTFAPAPETGVAWWSLTLTMTLFPVLYGTALLALHGKRRSLLFDSCWLFLSACGLSLILQAYLERGTAPFSGILAIPYLLALGCALTLVASITAVLSYRT